MTNNRRGIEPCDVAGCDRLIFAKSWCKKHYDRNRTHGNPETKLSTGPKSIPAPEEYFWKKVKIGAPDECWIWGGVIARRKDRKGLGYGRFQTNRKSYLAHRFSYALVHHLAPYTPVHHKCSNTLCVNPAHLQATTTHENTAEMLERRWYRERIAELEAQLAACTCG